MTCEVKLPFKYSHGDPLTAEQCCCSRTAAKFTKVRRSKGHNGSVVHGSVTRALRLGAYAGGLTKRQNMHPHIHGYQSSSPFPIPSETPSHTTPGPNARLPEGMPDQSLSQSSSSMSIWSPFGWPFAPAGASFLAIVASLSIICLDTATMLSSINCCPTSSKCFFGSSLPT